MCKSNEFLIKFVLLAGDKQIFMTKIGKYIGWFLVGLLCLVMTAYLVIQIPYVQTRLSQYVIGKLTKGIDADITVGSLNIRFFNRIHVEDFAIVSGDTLVAAKDIDARFSLRGLLDPGKSISSISVSDGVFNLINETDSTTNLDRIFPPSEDSSPLNLDARVKKLSVNNFRFNMYNPFIPSDAAKGQMDFTDLKVSNICLEAQDAAFKDGVLTAAISNLSADENCGFRLNSMSGNFILDGSGATLHKPDIVADGSHFKGDYLKLAFNSASDLKDFLGKVSIQTRFRQSTIAMKTIGRFAPQYLNSDLEMLASGETSGTVRNLTVKRLEGATKGGETSFIIKNLNLKGLPDAFNTRVSGEVERLSTNGHDLSYIISQLTDGKRIDFLDQLPRMQVWNYSGKVGGTIGHINSNGVLSSGSQRVAVNTTVNVRHSGPEPLVDLNLDADNLNLYTFTGSSMLGLFSGKGIIRVSSTPDNTTSVAIDSLNVRKLGINGYNLTGIFAKGIYEDERFDGKLICHDPALDLMFQGNISTAFKDGSTFNFYANIPYADLNALNLDKRDTINEISTFISADLFADSENNIFGYLKMDNTSFTNSHGYNYIGNLDAASLYENDKYIINVVSDFLKARYEGTTNIDSFIYQFRHQVLRRHFSNALKPYNQEQANETYGQDYSLTLKTLNTQGVCAFISPGLYIQSGTSLRIRVTEDDHYRVLANSGRLAYENNYLKNIRLVVTDRDSSIAASLFAKEIVAAGFAVDSTRLFANVKDNNADLSLRFQNDSVKTNSTSINAQLSIYRDSIFWVNNRPEHMSTPIALKLKESDVTLRGSKWNIRPAEIIYSDSLLVLDGLRIENNSQHLTAQGSISSVRPDSLGITMDNFDISILDQFLDQPLGLGGFLSGDADISFYDSDKMFASFTGKDILMNNQDVGDIEINAEWSPENKRYDFAVSSYLKGQETIDIDGFYRPSDNYVDIYSGFNDMPLTYIEPFLEGVASGTSGSLSGGVKIEGPVDDLSVYGKNCKLNKFGFTIDFLNVPLTVDGPVAIDEKGVVLKNCMLTDSLGGTGRVNGGISYNKLKDMKVKVGVTMNNLLSLDTEEKDNEDFYGKVFSTGSVNINGDLRHLVLDVNARTERKSQLHIPLSGASSASNSNILTFVQEEKPVEIDPYDTLYFAQSAKVSEPMEIEVNLNANATPDASVWLEIDKSTGDIMKATGNGRIGIKVNPKKNIFRLSGNYTIEEGSYHFVLMGLASRDFTVQPGSSVTLNGKIGNTALDIEALYTTKASIDRLISDSTSLATNRQVNATIKITGILDDPQIKFGIDIPDLDPTIKLMVDNALNSEDKIQKQFASLIAFGNFTPEAESGISSSGNSAIYSNAASMIVGQVNNLLMQLGIPLDLGFNYQQGSAYSNNAYEVAVSTQLFNNRVIINGSMGNDPYAYITGNDVRGNIDVQVKLDRRGKLRMTLFSHATDFYTNYLDMSQRTGAGMAYQHEFNSFKDLFRKRTAAQKEYEKMLKIKEKEERKAEKERKKEERRLNKAQQQSPSK